MSIFERLTNRVKGPQRELRTRLEEVELAARFVSSAVNLRPRLGKMLNWPVLGSYDRERVVEFSGFHEVNEAAVVSSLLVICYGTLEKYVGDLIEHSAYALGEACASVTELPESIIVENIFRTGRAFLSIKRNERSMDFEFASLAENVVSCELGKGAFVLNGLCFRYELGVITPENFDKGMGRLGIRVNWDRFGGDPEIKKVLGMTKTRECTKQLRKEIVALVRDRNAIAHAGCADSSRSVVDVCRYTRLLPRFCVVMTEQVGKEMDVMVA